MTKILGPMEFDADDLLTEGRKAFLFPGSVLAVYDHDTMTGFVLLALSGGQTLRVRGTSARDVAKRLSGGGDE